MNKIFGFFLVGCCVLAGCKKETDLPIPEEMDFTGQYFFSAKARKLSGNDATVYSIIMKNVVDSAGNYYELQVEYSSNSQYRYTSSRLEKNIRSEQLNFFVYAGEAITSDIISNLWTVAELDSIFQENKVLPFGESFGQVGMELVHPILTEGRIYQSIGADNSGNFARIEKIEDMKTYFPESKWAKTVTFSFDCNLKNGINSLTLPEIELFDCHATLLFKPHVTD